MSGEPLRVALRTLGCKVNQVDAERIVATILNAGASLTSEEDAEVVLITTCTVTREADHKARKMVRHALRLPSQPLVVVTGCLAAVDPDGVRSLGERIIVEPDKERVAARIGEAFGRTRSADAATVVRAGEGFHTRAMVKVEDGCDSGCTYCIVPRARGVPRAVPVGDVVAEVRALREAGVREVVLTGINIGRYDDGGVRLPELIMRVAETGIERIRLSSIEPEHVDDALLSVVRATPAFCEHLHVPLQSGSDAVLAAMGRRYDTVTYEAVIEAARRALPHLAVTTDVIAGFPGETDDDHARTMAFIERLGPAKLHVFRYSQRPGTPAAVRPDQVAPAVRAGRARELRELSESLQARHLAVWRGKRVEVIVDDVAPRQAAGVARDGSRVILRGAGVSVGDLVVALVEDIVGGRLVGRVERREHPCVVE